MTRFHQNTQSIWQEDIVLSDMPTLSKSLNTDVCIVGAGIAGLLTAYELLKKEFKVVVIDRDDLGYGETALTSAHISDVYDDLFTQLIKKFGKDKARVAYASHRAAIDLIEKIILEEHIDCDFKRVDGFLFLDPKHDPKFLEEEFRAALDCGAEDAHLQGHPNDVFFDTGACIRFGHQAQFHPLKFLNGLCERIHTMGGQIFTRTKAEFIQDGKSPRVETSKGYSITCDHVLVATNVPMNNMLSLHVKEAAYRSYVIGLKIPRGQVPTALYWDTQSPYHYIRVDSAPERDFDVLVIGGEDHRVGQEAHPEFIFQKLRDWVEMRLGIKDAEVVYTWSGQIIEPAGGLAYIGRNPGDKNVYVCTGDSGQGITHAGVCAILIPAMIEGIENHPYEAVYDPNRIVLRNLSQVIREGTQTNLQYADWVYRDEKDVQDLLPGEGCVSSHGLSKMAVYRDHDGDLHRFSAVCPHMNGVVKWNAVEETWDCPCHGSRFSKMGEVLNGPAIHDLSPHKDEERSSEEVTIKKKSGNDIDLSMRGSR